MGEDVNSTVDRVDQPGTGGHDALYEADFYTWTQRQAALLRAGHLEAADVANIAEEIETLGRSEVAELRSRYKIVCVHLLKKMYQPSKDGRSWTTTVVDQRVEIAQHLADNPGLKAKRDALFDQAYRQARKVAAAETGLEPSIFPEAPAFSRSDAENESFWPAPQSAGA